MFFVVSLCKGGEYFFLYPLGLLFDASFVNISSYLSKKRKKKSPSSSVNLAGNCELII